MGHAPVCAATGGRHPRDLLPVVPVGGRHKPVSSFHSLGTRHRRAGGRARRQCVYSPPAPQTRPQQKKRRPGQAASLRIQTGYAPGAALLVRYTDYCLTRAKVSHHNTALPSRWPPGSPRHVGPRRAAVSTFSLDAHEQPAGARDPEFEAAATPAWGHPLPPARQETPRCESP